MFTDEQKRELQAHLERYARANFDLGWRLERPDRIIYKTGSFLSSGDVREKEQADKLLDSLSKLNNHVILPVISWYRKTLDFGGKQNREIVMDTQVLAYAKKIGRETGIPVYEGVVKVNYTNQKGADNKPLTAHSFFAGSIEPGHDYIIIDDVVVKGKTVRDLAKYIENQGGTVRYVVEMGGFISANTPFDFKYQYAHTEEKFYSAMKIWFDWVDKISDSTRFEKLSPTEKVEFTDFIKQDSVRYLNRIGLSFDQLTQQELENIHKRIFQISGQHNFRSPWEMLTHEIPDAKAPAVDEIHKPDELLNLINLSIRTPEILTSSFPKRNR